LPPGHAYCHLYFNPYLSGSHTHYATGSVIRTRHGVIVLSVQFDTLSERISIQINNLENSHFFKSHVFGAN
jgi:hypothetical protein